MAKTKVTGGYIADAAITPDHLHTTLNLSSKTLTIGATTVSGHLIPSANITYDLGSSTNRFRDIYLDGNTIDLGGTKFSKDSSGDIEIKDSSNNLKKIKVSEIEFNDGSNVRKLKISSGKIKSFGSDDSPVKLDLSDVNTADIAEGTNLYFTTARARGAISVSGNALSYNSSTGVLTANYEESPSFTGNITVSGTVDGRDIAADGTKLDGIESGATADQTQSDINALGITATGLSGTPNITVGTINSGLLTVGSGAGAIKINESFITARSSDNANDINLIANINVFDADDVVIGSTSGQRFNDNIVFRTNGSQALRLDSSQNATFAGTLQATSFSDGTISGITFIDEDSFATNSAVRVPTQQSIKAYVDAKVAGVVDTAPAALNTLNELAAALGDDANFSTTTSTALGNRLRVDINNQGLTGTQQANAITNLGITATKAELNYVDGVTSSIQTQLNTKITNSTASLDANKITSGVLNSARIPSPVNGDWWNGGFVKVGADGVMEVGKYLDFHTSDSGGNTDYDLRVTASAGALTVGGTINSGAITSTGILTLDTSPASNGVGDLVVIPSLNSSSGVGYAGQVFGVNVKNAVHSTHNAPQVSSTWGGVTGATAIAIQADDNSYGQFQVWTAPQDSSADDLLVPRFYIGGSGAATFTGTINSGAITSTSTVTASGGNSGNWNTAYGWGNHASAGYITDGNTNWNNSYGFITASDSSITNKLPLAGGTLTGGTTYNVAGNAITISSSAPQIRLNDTTSGADDFWIHVNSNIFYILGDRGDDGSWETPHPLALNSSTNVGTVFGSRLFTEDYHPNADTWTTARTITLGGDLTGNVSINGSANVTLTAAVVADSHNHVISNVDGLQSALDGKLASSSYTASDVLTKIKTVDGSGSGLDADTLDGIQASGFMRGGRTLTTIDTISNGGDRYDPSTNNPTNEHYAVLTYGNGGNVTGQLATHFQTGNLYSRGYNSSWSAWRTNWNSLNDGSGSGLDADLLDGQQGSHYLNYNNLTNKPTIPSTSGFLQAGGSWAAANMPGSRYTGLNVNGGEVAFLRDNPNTSQMSVLVDGAFYAGENNGFYSLYSGNSYNSKSGFYADTSGRLQFSGQTYAQFNTQYGNIQLGPMNGSYAHIYTNLAGGFYFNKTALYANGNTMWHAGNDGPGSGLDADLLDGLNSTSFARKGNVGYQPYTDLFTFSSNSSGASTSGDQSSIQIYNPSSGNDAFITFHVSGDYAGYFGLDGATNDLFWGGWSRGAAKYKIWHAANDGAGSGLDADTLDGQQGSYYTTASNLTGTLNKDRLPNFVHLGTATTAGYATDDGGWGSRLNVSSNVHARIEVSQEANSMRSHWYAHTGHDSIKFGTSTSHDVEIQRGGTTRIEATSAGATVSGALLMSGGPLRRSNHHSGHLEGSYNNVGDNSYKSNPIYTIGSSYNPVDASLSNMYGIGYGHTNASFISMTGASGWGMYVAADGDARIYLGGSNGVISSTGQHYVGSNVVWNAGNDGSGSGLDADLLDGYHASTTYNAANTVPIRDANGYLNLGYINTNIGTEALSHDWTKVYASTDNYIRPYGKSDFKVRMGLTKSDYDRMDYSANTAYHTGANSHNDVNFNDLLTRGCGFIDNWNGGTGKPPTGSHYNGFQALHYSASGTYHHGMQMVMSAGNPALTFLRGWWANGGSGFSWQKIWTDGNDGSGSTRDHALSIPLPSLPLQTHLQDTRTTRHQSHPLISHYSPQPPYQDEDHTAHSTDS